LVFCGRGGPISREVATINPGNKLSMGGGRQHKKKGKVPWSFDQMSKEHPVRSQIKNGYGQRGNVGPQWGRRGAVRN